MITQNKGEWSELYVFLKLLGDGVLYAADSDLNRIDDLYYPLIEVLRKENEQVKHYVKDEPNIAIKDDKGKTILKLPMSEFEIQAKTLLKTIKKSASTFSVPEIEKFMGIIQCAKVKADSSDKSDISLILHDCKTYRNEIFGFSIKSKLGHPSTLLNSGKTTNFVYEIEGDLSEKQIKDINEINTRSKLRDRLIKLEDYGCKLIFKNLINENFQANLQMIDTSFPLILSEYLFLYFSGNGSLISELTSLVQNNNPCNLNTDLPHLYYEHKMKNFLTDIALGMTPATVWTGTYQATGGYIIVREDGEVLCYHVYNHNEFQKYLFKNTRFDTPSTSRYDFGYIYSQNNKLFMNLNIQIRFI